MLNASINTLDPQIKRNDFSLSPNVLERLSMIRKRNEELVEALDHSVARFQQVLAFYQADAYSA